ncbi:hypothetical protein DFJ74DRAFT_426145 [Hyaloraphidium curvatum]|nr:hypothetical protein DFJ74DRAFT_426145 [Hyaloraphidium curvatum]
MPVAHYVIGFGSLLLPESLRRTVGDALVPGSERAVRVRGFRRAWAIRGRTMTVVTAIRDASEAGGMPALAFGLTDDAALALLDKREIGYNRTPVPWELLELHESHSGLGAPWLESEGRAPSCWIYVSCSDPLHPDPAAAVAQSYLDVCMAGALRISRSFAKEFVEETWRSTAWVAQRAIEEDAAWDEGGNATQDGTRGGTAWVLDRLAWIDDRLAPRYPRFETPPLVNHGEIDAVLEEALGAHPDALRTTVEEALRLERANRVSVVTALARTTRAIAEKAGFMDGNGVDASNDDEMD